MSAKDFKHTAGKIIRKEIKNERNRQRENNDLNLTAKVLIMTRLVISYLEDCIILEIFLSGLIHNIELCGLAKFIPDIFFNYTDIINNSTLLIILAKKFYKIKY